MKRTEEITMDPAFIVLLTIFIPLAGFLIYGVIKDK